MKAFRTDNKSQPWVWRFIPGHLSADVFPWATIIGRNRRASVRSIANKYRWRLCNRVTGHLKTTSIDTVTETLYRWKSYSANAERSCPQLILNFIYLFHSIVITSLWYSIVVGITACSLSSSKTLEYSDLSWWKMLFCDCRLTARMKVVWTVVRVLPRGRIPARGCVRVLEQGRKTKEKKTA